MSLMKEKSSNYIDNHSDMLCLIVLFIVIQQTISTSCENIQIEDKTKFILKSDSYTPIDNNSLINWFYQKFSIMNIQFPWGKFED
jgi:hypothetical protein